ncbi:hypothetical protein [Nitrospirillum amazonense]|uniref:hypothetical protein n=1 Tax=Nitrospirillum amazonense TaxID=28077 RepID=UPI002412D399|nr:hypothetical protein [Nitrospirillum amazonense]MDG3444680.1 hypothetical protein [Nitrospirillum amazonense]
MAQINIPTLRAECLMVAIEHVREPAAARQLADRMVNLVVATTTPAPAPALVSPAVNPCRLNTFPPPWFRAPVSISKP